MASCNDSAFFNVQEYFVHPILSSPDPRSLSIATNQLPALDTHLPSPPTLQKSLWKSNIPLPNLSASQYETGYWMPVRSFDTIQMQALIFGTTETELEQVTGYSSDAKCQFFGAHFRNGTEHYIGMNESEREEKNKKTFLIDGEGGERVSKVEVGMNHLPTGIKVCLPPSFITRLWN